MLHQQARAEARFCVELDMRLAEQGAGLQQGDIVGQPQGATTDAHIEQAQREFHVRDRRVTQPGRWRVALRRAHAAAGLGTIAFSLVLLGQLRGHLVLTLLLCALLGLGAALLAIPAQTTIQVDTPEAQRGKVFGLQNNLINIALSLPLALAGTVVSRYGLLPVLWGLAAIALIAALSEQPWRPS